MIRVLVVDDSPGGAEAIRNMLLTDPEIRVTGIVRNGEEALLFTGRERPDVIAMTLAEPGATGCKLIAWITETNRVPVVLVSASRVLTALKQAFDALDQPPVAALKKPGTFGSRDFAKNALGLIETVKSIAGREHNSPFRQQSRPSEAFEQR